MLNDRFSHTDKPFHSTGYAEVSRGTSMGSTNAQSFGDRARVDLNRRHIQRYGDSHLANAPFRRTMDDNGGQSDSIMDRRQGVIQPKPIVIPPRTQQRPRFSEPPGRNYNPFG